MKDNPVFGLTYIDDQPWLVTLPDGSSSRDGSTKSEYAKMLASVGKDAFHCAMGSWCSNWAAETRWDEEGEGFYWHETGHVCQYDGPKENWDIHRKDYRGYGTGFRPVLIPLDPETLQPDPDRLSMIKDGSSIRMGTLYMNGTAVMNPTDPIGCGQPRYGMSGPPVGNTPKYVKDAPLQIGDTHMDPGMQINFIKAGDRLVSDRVILGCVSVSDLETHLMLKDYVPIHTNEMAPKEPIELWGRLGVSMTVTPEEFEILRGEEETAQALLIQLVQSGRCSMCGDTYFPEPANETYLKDDLNFDLPERPLHGGPQLQNTKIRGADPSTLESRLSDAHNRSSAGHAAPDSVPKPPEH